MSAATAEKPKEAPASPLGSFITKLTPKPVEKADEKPAEAKAAEKSVEAKDATAKSDAGGIDATAPKAQPDVAKEAEAGKTAALKTDEKPEKDILDKRLKDTQKWGNEEHKARLDAERKAAELEAQLKRIEAKLDGTYEEPKAPSADEAKAAGDAFGRIRASHAAAIELHGEEFVNKTVWNLDSPYQQIQARSPRLKARVMEAEAPVLEAIKVVKEEEAKKLYGDSPEEMRKKIREEELPKLKQEILEGLKTKPGPATNTLGNVRGGTERTEQKNEAPTRLDFRQVFPWGASRT